MAAVKLWARKSFHMITSFLRNITVIMDNNARKRANTSVIVNP